MLCSVGCAEGKGMGGWGSGDVEEWSWALEFCCPGILGGILLESRTDSFAAGTAFDHDLTMLLQRECLVSRQHGAGHGG